MSFRELFNAKKNNLEAQVKHDAETLNEHDLDDLDLELEERPRAKRTRARKPGLTEDRVREIVEEMIQTHIQTRIPIQQPNPNPNNLAPNLLLQSALQILDQISRWKKFSNDQPLSQQIRELIERIREYLQ